MLNKASLNFRDQLWSGRRQHTRQLLWHVRTDPSTVLPHVVLRSYSHVYDYDVVKKHLPIRNIAHDESWEQTISKLDGQLTKYTVYTQLYLVDQENQKLRHQVRTLANRITSLLSASSTSHAVDCEEDLHDRFARLAAEWGRDTEHLSFMRDITAHPAYQQIIGLGPAALPLILGELKERGGHWFHALRAITRENPIPDEHRGKVRLMKEAWLNWGRQKHYL
jgi:hypothetical protein